MFAISLCDMYRSMLCYYLLKHSHFVTGQSLHAFDDAWEEGRYKTTISAENEVEAQKLANNYRVTKPPTSSRPKLPCHLVAV